MTTSYLNNLKLSTGTKFMFTQFGIAEIRPVDKAFPELPNIVINKTYEVTELKTSYAMDEHTEICENTTGVIGFKDDAGNVYNINALDPEECILWAFFTEFTPENVVLMGLPLGE